MASELYRILGLAKRANKLLSGHETCETAIKSGEAKLVLVSLDASDNTNKKFTDMCHYRKINIRRIGEKELLGKCIGKMVCSVVCILDEGFSKKILGIIDDMNFHAEVVGFDKN